MEEPARSIALFDSTIAIKLTQFSSILFTNLNPKTFFVRILKLRKFLPKFIMSRKEETLTRGFEKCRQITKKYGTSYYFATQFFPSEIRQAIYALYAFARIPDEFVDNPDENSELTAKERIENFRDDWRNAMRDKAGGDEITSAIASTFRKYRIPQEHGEAFFRSMIQDTEKATYQNYAELEDYMYGSAGVIGLMITHVVGYSSDKAFKHALQLGYAFQLTNFLRDIGEDWDERRRVYLPQDELAQFGLTNSDIANCCLDERFIAFMKFQIKRNREIYREALKGIPMLSRHGRLAVRIAFVLYSAILGRIEANHYNVYSKRARTNFSQKLKLSAKAFVGIYE